MECKKRAGRLVLSLRASFVSGLLEDSWTEAAGRCRVAVQAGTSNAIFMSCAGTGTDS